MDDDAPTVRLERFADDPGRGPHAVFRAEVAERARLDPLPALESLSELTGVPVGALARHALVQWTSAGSEALLAMGPAAVTELLALVERLEAAAGPERDEVYAELAGRIRWIAAGLDAP